MSDRLRGQDAIGKLTGVSPANFAPELRAQMSLPPKVIINDLTLREGRQSEGTILTVDECVRIAEQLVGELKVQNLQMGNYAPRDPAYLKAVKKALSDQGLHPVIETMTSAHQNFPKFKKEQLFDSVDRIADAGAGIVICLALSNQMLRACGGLRGEGDKPIKYLQQQEIGVAVEAIRRAKARGMPIVNVNFQDFLRADLDYTLEFSRCMVKEGVNYIKMDDFGGGVGIPLLYKERFKAVRNAIPGVKLGLHFHNTIGMASACALAAIEEGAEFVDVGLNGYGEGAGHVSLAETVYALEFLYGYDTGIRLEKLRETAILVADIMRKHLPATTPLVGDSAFAFMGDKHHQFPDYPFLFSPIDASVVGNEARPGFGEWAGPFGLRIWATRRGISIPDGKIQTILERMREKMRWSKRVLTDGEIQALVD